MRSCDVYYFVWALLQLSAFERALPCLNGSNLISRAAATTIRRGVRKLLGTAKNAKRQHSDRCARFAPNTGLGAILMTPGVAAFAPPNLKAVLAPCGPFQEAQLLLLLLLLHLCRKVRKNTNIRCVQRRWHNWISLARITKPNKISNYQ